MIEISDAIMHAFGAVRLWVLAGAMLVLLLVMLNACAWTPSCWSGKSAPPRGEDE